MMDISTDKIEHDDYTAQGVHRITADFENELCRYTGALYAVAVDNQSNALFLSLTFDQIQGKVITIPRRTYPSVPCEIIHAGGYVEFAEQDNPDSGTLRGAYPLRGSRVIDSALSFTYNMYSPGHFVCLSFTGPYKHLKLGKGGAILTDNWKAYKWFKQARFSGRHEISYHRDKINMLGWNFYMMPEIAARGLLLMAGFWNMDGTPKYNEDLEIAYPDLSQFEVYTKR